MTDKDFLGAYKERMMGAAVLEATVLAFAAKHSFLRENIKRIIEDPNFIGCQMRLVTEKLTPESVDHLSNQKPLAEGIAAATTFAYLYGFMEGCKQRAK